MSGALLEVRDLSIDFATPGGPLAAVRGVDLQVAAGSVLGVVGESGSGKTITMLAVMGLLPPNARVRGSVRFAGEELIGRSPRELRRLRGARLAMIFQDPLTALNPVLTIGAQIAEAIRLHQRGVSRRQALERAAELLDLVSIPEPEQRIRQYPHEFSGGMRQRATIAMAIANEPDLLIADEPTTALDVTVQAQILDVLARLRQRLGLALVLITHDLGVVAGTADRVAVMYAGRIAEEGPVDAVYGHSHHPYTRGLLASLPRLDRGAKTLEAIAGAPPTLSSRPPGCAFHPRCRYAIPRCRTEDPALSPIGDLKVACHRAREVGAERPLEAAP